MTEPGTHTPRSPRRWGWLRLVGTLASLVLLGWLLSRQDWGTLTKLALGIPPRILATALALIWISQLWSSARWWVLLRAQAIRVSYGRAYQIVASGLFASNFLPTTIGGDVVRLAGILPRAPNATVAAASLIADRAIGVASMVTVLPLSAVTFGPLLSAGSRAPGLAAAGVGPWLRRQWARAVEAVRPWRERPQSVVLSLVAAWASVFFYVASIWFVTVGLGMGLTLSQVAAVAGITYFVTLIPISINALGLREAAMITLYTLLGATAEQASALALITRALVMLSTIPGAVWVPGILEALRTRKSQVSP